MNLLFVCGRNRWRSPTAEAIFAEHEGIEVDSAGLDRDAVVRVSHENLAWADLIFVMEKVHRVKLQRQFSKVLSGKRLICLDIPDRYELMDPSLVTLLERKVLPYLPSGRSDTRR